MKYSKHFMSRTRFYGIWAAVINRVSNVNDPRLIKYYSGRGIKVCDEWLVFSNFKNDMYQLYVEHVKLHGEKDTTIDRIDNEKGYEPGNCRWATYSVQAFNRRIGERESLDYKKSSSKTYIQTIYKNGKKTFLVTNKETNEVLREI